MAITVAAVFDGVNTRTFDVTSTVDEDTAAVIPHGLDAIPFYVLTALSFQGIDAGWYVSDAGPESITVTKRSTAGTQDTEPQLRVQCTVPNAKDLG